MYADLATELPNLELVVTIGDDSSSAPVTAWDTLMSSVTAPMISAVVSLNEPDPDSICLLLYTSGTTAAPKGALHSHNTLVYENRIIIDCFGLASTTSSSCRPRSAISSGSTTG